MKVKSIEFTIEDIINIKGRIDPKPQYQRTPVWKLDRQRLLIDSIFKGYDLPKFYLNDLSGNAYFDFEVCDGQQRLRAIWEFYDDKFSLGKESSFNGTSLVGKKYSELSTAAKKYFTSFNLTIAQIVEADHNEIRDLFARLQKGMGLNQAELRRALSTHIGTYVESIVENHKFFEKCGFPNLRNKHQDYIDHVIAFLVYDFEYDFKGKSLRDVYVKISPLQASQLIKDVAIVLDYMEKINSYSIGVFRNKWAFVDTFVIISQNRKIGKTVMPKEFCKAFIEFEKKRVYNRRNPRLLIQKEHYTEEDNRLYEYIISFTKDGSLKANMKRRNIAFSTQFNDLFR